MGNQKKVSKLEWKEFLNRIRAGETVTAACEVLNISRSSPYRKRQRNERFAIEWDLADRDSIELLSDLVIKAAMRPEAVEKFDSTGQLIERTVKPPNLYNAIRVLERRHPHWKPSADVSGDAYQVNVGSASIMNGRLCLGGKFRNGG